MTQMFRTSATAALLTLGLLAAPAAADVCVTVDESRDTFSPGQRSAALVLLTREFERAGERVVPDGCPSPYLVSHVQFGSSIVIALSGPSGQRTATAVGLDDVPAVYSQMVRSLLSGRPMDAYGVLDRTNVAEGQAAPANRVHSDSVVYARLGYATTFADRSYGGPSVGVFGYRKELNAFAIDVSFLNFQFKTSNGPSSYDAYGYSSGSGSSAFSGNWLKLEVLKFATPLSDRSFYFGGGLSVGATNLDNDRTSWNGAGLQGELTAGYELGRASTIRMFLQADAGFPFYSLTRTTYTYGPRYGYTVATDRRYAPTVTVSVGLGWQRGRR